MHNRLLDITIQPALGGLCYSNLFEKYAYYAISCLELVKPQCIKFVGLAKEGVNLHFKEREIKAAPLCFALLSDLIMSH